MQQIVHNWLVIHEFIVVVNFVFKRLIIWPRGIEMQKIMYNFKYWCGLHNVQGVIDGTYVLIPKSFIMYPKDYYHMSGDYHNGCPSYGGLQ
jgi:hypothetical protein